MSLDKLTAREIVCGHLDVLAYLRELANNANTATESQKAWEMYMMQREKFVDKVLSSVDIIDNPILEKIWVVGITIPSVEECDWIPHGLLKYKDAWWLQSKGAYHDYAAIVFADGTVSEKGCDVEKRLCVRPALLLNSTWLPVGFQFEKYGVKWQIVKRGYAFCCADIGRGRFCDDAHAVDDPATWWKSDIWKAVQSWWETAKEEEKGNEND